MDEGIAKVRKNHHRRLDMSSISIEAQVGIFCLQQISLAAAS
jgi:hypothetical protein